ncbi:hypothetical protein CALCODRAFT_499545 [Calocera cornea HHB12733]|uniref:Uncharacterized protein n=1 Tax=Calocera cornea HHB12733 TaxID=1353952 RepID=A0A165EER1_9BASI|nr:hypothetical protein CALCODRAFT_499545 [Calocera cornea HHB12733]
MTPVAIACTLHGAHDDARKTSNGGPPYTTAPGASVRRRCSSLPVFQLHRWPIKTIQSFLALM